jgi:hypothetical protein
MKNISKIVVLSFLFIFAFTAAKPAKAFYLEVPASLKSLLSLFKSNKSMAQEAGTYQGIGPAPGTGTGYQGIGPDPSIPIGSSPGTPGQSAGYQGIGPDPSYPIGQAPGTGTGYQGIGPDPSIYIGTPPGTQTGQQGQQGQYQGDQGHGQQGPSPEQQAKQLAQIKKSMKQMGRMVKQFEQMFASAEKKGTAIPEEVKQNLAKLKGILDAVQNANSTEDLQDVDMSEIQDLTQSLEDFRRDTIEKAQQIAGLKQAVKGMEQGLKMFERQVANLTKKGIPIPTNIAEHIAKFKDIIAKVKIATSFEDVQEDMEGMQDLMETFDQDRQQLEALARWPQTLKQINSELTKLTRELARSKVIVDRLAKKGIDITDLYVSFTDAVNKLKSVRDDAVARMAAGDSDGAFSVLEDDFFGQLDDTWQHQRLVMMMNNLGRFAIEFKQNMARANTTVKKLKRKKLDTSELEALVEQIKGKSQEILALIKVEDFDEDAIADALNEVENLKQEFEAKVDELTGEEDELPWQKGPQQFRKINLPPGFNKLVPPKPEPQPEPPIQPPLAKCTATPLGLVGWWSGDEVVVGAAPTLDKVTLVSGKVGNAFKFDGSGGGVKMGNPASLNFGTAPFSLEAWVNWDGKGSSINNIFRKSNYGSDPGSGYWVRIGRDNKTIEFSVGSTSGPVGQSLITAPITPGVWHHVVATRDSSDAIKLYVDGISVGSVVRQATKAQSTSESQFALGLWTDQNSEYFSGLIDEASAYNRALDASEVQAIFNAGSDGKCLSVTPEPQA